MTVYKYKKILIVYQEIEMNGNNPDTLKNSLKIIEELTEKQYNDLKKAVIFVRQLEEFFGKDLKKEEE